jgi:two-component system CheB/CheR fusion protein
MTRKKRGRSADIPADAVTHSAQSDNFAADRHAQPVALENSPRLPFAVVGMGASAGGLQAFSDFFKTLPATRGMAYVLIQHLPPQRESMMVDILSKRTDIPVLQVEDGMPVEPDHVYVIRPGHTLTIKDGRLRLGAQVDKPGHSRPVDDFFKSLAEEQQERAIAVVMSGMGSNGTQGAEVVKSSGRRVHRAGSGHGQVPVHAAASD